VQQLDYSVAHRQEEVGKDGRSACRELKDSTTWIKQEGWNAWEKMNASEWHRVVIKDITDRKNSL
jgi:hypothetical protein